MLSSTLLAFRFMITPPATANTPTPPVIIPAVARPLHRPWAGACWDAGSTTTDGDGGSGVGTSDGAAAGGGGCGAGWVGEVRRSSASFSLQSARCFSAAAL